MHVYLFEMLVEGNFKWKPWSVYNIIFPPSCILSWLNHKTDSKYMSVVKIMKTVVEFLISVTHLTVVASFIKVTDICKRTRVFSND